MKNINLSRSSTLIIATLIAVFTVLAGLSGLIYPSSSSPLFFLSGILAIGVVIFWLAKPTWALYTALILVFLPIGMIPADIHSLFNRFVTVIAAGVWLIRLLWARKKIFWKDPTILMSLFLIWSSVTLFWAENTEPAITTLQVYLMRLILFLVLIPNEINTKRKLDGLMKTLAIIGWVVIISYIGTLVKEGYTIGSRLSIFGENQNKIGVVALISMTGILWQASQPSKNHHVLRLIISFIFILLTIVLVAMTGSRGSALSLVVTFCAFWFWKSTRSWAIQGFLIAALALVVTPSIFLTLDQRFAVQGHDTLLGGREVLWQAAWHMIQDYPLGGVGIGNAPYKILSFLEFDPRVVGAERSAIHNPVLTIWSETGIPGILFYIGALAYAVKIFYQQYLRFKKLKSSMFIAYFSLVSSITLGYMVSWVKGGGLESDVSYFFILALLTLPSVLDISTFETVLGTSKKSAIETVE